MMKFRKYIFNFILAIIIVLANGGLWAWGGLALLLLDAFYRFNKIRIYGKKEKLFLFLYSIIRLSLFGLIILQPSIYSKIGLIVIFISSIFWLNPYQKTNHGYLISIVAIGQFLILSTIFLAQMLWHTPLYLSLIILWSTSFIIAECLLFSLNESKNHQIIAAAWALIVTEISWILSIWQVSYILPREILIIPQPAVITTALGYCLGGIYLAHNQNRLNRIKLIEYLIVGLLVLGVVISGTNWRGTI